MTIHTNAARMVIGYGQILSTRSDLDLSCVGAYLRMQHLQHTYSDCALVHRADVFEPAFHRGDVTVCQGLEVTAS